MAQHPDSTTDPMDAVSHLSRESFKDDEIGRLSALSKARDLCRRLENPSDALMREIWLAPSTSTAIKIGQDINLFTVLPQPQEEGQTADELAKKTSTDPRFLSRILRLLASVQFIEETKTGCFRGTNTSQEFTKPGFIGGLQHMFTQILPVFQALPRYMAENKYVLPEEPSNGPFQFGMGGPETFFEWLGGHPNEGKGFNDLMGVQFEQTWSNWVDVFPASQLLDGVSLKPDRPLIIDVGGGIGSDMERLRTALLPQTYRIVIQDLPHVVEQGQARNLDKSIEFHVHDFFTEQPIKGARAYFMHGCLHDWPDPLAQKILRHLKAAMEPGYSKLLIDDAIQPERAEMPLGGALDLVMMGLLASKERTELEWRELLDSVGFRVIKVWGKSEVSQCVIEAEPIF